MASGHSKEERLALSMLTLVQLGEATELVRPGDGNRWHALEALLGTLSVDLRGLSETLTRVYFTHAVPTRQLASR